MSMQGHLEEREDRAEDSRKQATRDAAMRKWFGRDQAPEVRLAAFDSWLLQELAARLDWKWAGVHKDKRIHQFRVQIDGMVLELWRRGWMLDEKRLADRIVELLEAVATYQRKGKVAEIWPYFKACASRYVGLNAEEIREDALHAGAAVADVFSQLLRKAPKTPSMPELVAQRAEETLRAKVNRLKRPKARKTAEEPLLPGL